MITITPNCFCTCRLLKYPLEGKRCSNALLWKITVLCLLFYHFFYLSSPLHHSLVAWHEDDVIEMHPDREKIGRRLLSHRRSRSLSLPGHWNTSTSDFNKLTSWQKEYNNFVTVHCVTLLASLASQETEMQSVNPPAILVLDGQMQKSWF